MDTTEKPSDEDSGAQKVTPQFDPDVEYFDEDGDAYEEPTDEEIAAEECGRWINGRLGPHCTKAGSEECDWECPYSR